WRSSPRGSRTVRGRPRPSATSAEPTGSAFVSSMRRLRRGPRLPNTGCIVTRPAGCWPPSCPARAQKLRGTSVRTTSCSWPPDAPGRFDSLMHILDSETRLLTPMAPADREEAENSGSDTHRTDAEIPGDTRYYQLTHDYLVPSIREWLARQQKERLRGRVELML